MWSHEQTDGKVISSHNRAQTRICLLYVSFVLCMDSILSIPNGVLDDGQHLFIACAPSRCLRSSMSNVCSIDKSSKQIRITSFRE